MLKVSAIDSELNDKSFLFLIVYLIENSFSSVAPKFFWFSYIFWQFLLKILFFLQFDCSFNVISCLFVDFPIYVETGNAWECNFAQSLFVLINWIFSDKKSFTKNPTKNLVQKIILHKNNQLMLEFLKAPFLVPHFSYYTLMTFLMTLSVILPSMLMILLSVLSVIMHLICSNNLNWLLNLNLILETLE